MAGPPSPQLGVLCPAKPQLGCRARAPRPAARARTPTAQHNGFVEIIDLEIALEIIKGIDTDKVCTRDKPPAAARRRLRHWVAAAALATLVRGQPPDCVSRGKGESLPVVVATGVAIKGLPGLQ